MDFLILGAGSIGSVVGAFLQMSGHRVFFWGRGRRVEALKNGGLEITGLWGEHELDWVEAGSSPDEFRESGMKPDWILLAVKSVDTAEAMAQIPADLFGARGVVSLQNGLGNLEVISGVASPERTVAGRVIFGAHMIRPGRVEVTVCADALLLGPFERGPDGIEELCAVLDDSGIPCRYEEKILSFIWDKVIYNACLNPLGTVLGVTYGELADDRETWYLMVKIVNECYAVANKVGIDLISATPEEYLARFKEELIPPTRGHRPSMQEDIERGRPTEVASLTGAIARLAAENGLRAPVNDVMTRLIKSMERRKLGSDP